MRRIFIHFIGSQFNGWHILQMIGMFCYISLGSIAIGCIIGFFSALVRILVF